MAVIREPEIGRLCLPQAAAGWAVPGLGHVLLGQRVRGGIIGLTVLLLWLVGLLIGGVGAIDRDAHPAWFVPQAMMGPTLAVAWLDIPPSTGDDDGGYVPAFGHVDEQAILFTAVAGMLNLLAVIDVAYRPPGRDAAPTEQP